MAYRSTREAAIADVGRAITMATGGAIAFAAVEYVVTLGAYAGVASVASKLRLAALVATLSLVLLLLLAAGLATVLLARRAIVAQLSPDAARGPTWFTPTPLTVGVRAGVPALWAAVVTAGIAGIVIQRGAVVGLARFKEPQLTAALIAGLALVVLAVSPLMYRATRAAAQLGADALAPVLGAANPLGRWRSAGVALAALAGAALAACWLLLPQSRSILPVRLVASAAMVVLGAGVGALVHASRQTARRSAAQRWGLAGVLAALAVAWTVVPGAAGLVVVVRIAIAAVAIVVAILLGSELRVRRRSRRRGLAVATLSLALCTLTLLRWGAELETKYIAITASPALDKLIGLIRTANDLDRDGFGTVLGEADCAPFDRKINPGAIEVPDDDIDQNCDGRDFSLASLHTPTGPTVEVPAEFRRPWNVLLITVDTVRYDRTSFGGYATSPKQRDTTPRLAELVKRSTSFTFANAPSAGTMASIPAILTSKFFHSGIAIGPDTPGRPPKILPENTTLPEIMKRGGYATGAIGSHEYWNDWGVEQGVDDFDNSIGKTGDPYRVAADKVTDHALAWISRQQGKKWFMWAHYIDPHGRYVAHPNVVDYGATESDLYDAELRWTDQELGRLFDELRRLPSHGNTLIVITSDHGDSMAEHNIPLGTHGTALYREMLHVPLIFYVPDNRPHTIGGAVTPLDIVPTLAELCGIDVRDLSFEGRSLVPALFAGREDRDRIVFAETNAGQKQRAAVSSAFKLIYYLQTNVYELFDLAADPWEHTNLAPTHHPALPTMKQALQQWMERVVFARDPLFNQSFRQMADLLVTTPPPIVTTGQQLGNAAIAVRGLGPADGARLAPGQKVDVHVYFEIQQPTTTSYRFQLVAWPADTEPADQLPATAIRSAMRPTADGMFPTSRWRVGERVRERFTITIPAAWTAAEMIVGLVAGDTQGSEKARATGAHPVNDPTVAVLGRLPVEVVGSSPPASP